MCAHPTAVRTYHLRAVGGATVSVLTPARCFSPVRRAVPVPSRAVFTPVAARDFYAAAGLALALSAAACVSVA
jgi:indole-3-glycerol phosphate synthase